MSNDFFFSFPFIKVRIFVLLLCLPFLSLNQELVLFLKFSLGGWTSVKRERDRERERERTCADAGNHADEFVSQYYICWHFLCLTTFNVLGFLIFFPENLRFVAPEKEWREQILWKKGLANWHCWVSYSIWMLKNDKKMERNVKLFHLICCRNLVEDKIWCNLLKSYAFSKCSFSQIGKLLISLNF